MKSNISLKFILLKRKKKANGEIPVYLRITKYRKCNFVATGISVEPKDWNDSKGEVRRANPLYKKYNEKLEGILIDARTTALDDENSPSSGQFKEKLVNEKLDNKVEPGFFEFAETRLDELKEQNKYWPRKQTITSLNHFKEYLKGSSITFGEITPYVLQKLQDYLLLDRKLKENTVSKTMERIKAIFRNALDKEITTHNPFDRFKPVTRVRTSKTHLTQEQIGALIGLDLTYGSWLCLARDTFIFSFYNAGIRFGDLARLKWRHIADGRLKYKMSKTGIGKNIKLIKPSLEILDKYRPNAKEPDSFIFPLLSNDLDYSDEFFLKRQISSKNVMTNKYLNKVAELAGIEQKISFHVSRHSFADFARSSGMNIFDISKALAHSDIKITQGYLKSFDEISLDDGMDRLFSNY